LLLIVDIIFY